MKTILGLVIFSCICWTLSAQTYDTNSAFVQTFAGSGFSGYLDGQGVQTMFSSPTSIVADSQSNLFVLDYNNARIRKITPDGVVSTFAGGGSGVLPAYATNISLSFAFGISLAVDRTNALWIVNNGLLRINPDGYAVHISQTFTGLTSSGSICFDSGNNMYFSSPSANKIYRWRTNGIQEVFAGSGNTGTIDGNGIFTSFNGPSQITCDSADNIYVFDSGRLIRRINQNRDVTTIAGKSSAGNADGQGTNAGFLGVSCMVNDSSGNVFVLESSCVRKMDAQTNITTIAGSFNQSGYTNDVSGYLARFSSASGLCLLGSNIYIADTGNQRVREISFNPEPVDISASSLSVASYAGIKITGIVGRSYDIQSSSDTSSWSHRETVLLTSSPFLWIDPNPISGNQFYRAIQLP